MKCPFSVFGWIGAALLLFLAPALPAQDTSDAPDRPFPKDFSATLTTRLSDGNIHHLQVYGTDGLVRVNNGLGDPMVFVLSEMRSYSLSAQNKVSLIAPYTPDDFHLETPAAPLVAADFQLIGPETLDGRNCLKYKGMAQRGDSVFYTWIDAVTHVPIVSMTEDRDVTISWSDYQPGPQDPKLFVLPPGWPVMTWAAWEMQRAAQSNP